MSEMRPTMGTRKQNTIPKNNLARCLAKSLRRFMSAPMMVVCLSLSSFAYGYDFGYQGRLTESSGKPVSGPVDLRITFYDSPTGGSSLFSQDVQGIALQEGVFNVNLSIGNSDYHNIFSSPERAVYVEITDLTHDPNAPYPRQKIGMQPLAGLASKVPVDNTTVGFNSEGKLSILSSDKIQGRSITTTAPSSGQVLQWNGTAWAPGTVTVSASSITNTEVSASAGIVDTKLATITTPGKVSGSAITSGTIGGSTILNTSGNITTSGNVGIGTTNPLGLLDVNQKLTVLSNGNVGIGTTAPASKLEVVGSISSKLPTSLTPTGMTETIDFAIGNSQIINLSSATGTVTLTFSNGQPGGVYTVFIKQGTSTTRDVLWPVSVKWKDGTAVSITQSANATDIITFIYDGINYYGSGLTNF